MHKPLPSPADGQRYLRGLWIGIALITPVIGWLGARGFAPTLGVMGALSLGYLKPRGTDWIGFGLLALLIAWSAASMSWSPASNVVVHSGKDFGRLTVLHMALQLLLSGAFVMAAARMRRRTAQTGIRWLGYGLLALAAVLVVESVEQAEIFKRVQGLIGKAVRPDIAVVNVSQGSYALVTLMWPAAVAMGLRKRRLWSVFLAAAVVLSTILLHGDSPSLALLLASLVFSAVFVLGRAAIAVLGGLASAYWLGAPAGVLGLMSAGVFQSLHGRLPPSWDARLNIWTFTVGQWLRHPFLGRGMDASRAFPHLIPLHPHDAALQVWFELGAPGALIMAAFWLLLFWRILKTAHDRLFAATACATATTYLTIGAISFGVWQEWWIALGAFALAACIALRLSGQPATHPVG